MTHAHTRLHFLRRGLLASGLASIVALSAHGAFYIKPHLQNVTKDGATIIWESTEENVGTVDVGASPDSMSSVKEGAAEKIHRVRLSGLEAGRTYTYRVKEGDEVFSATFKTAPKGAVPVTFVVVGDSRRWEDRWQATEMAKHALQWNPDFFINNGDLVRSGHDYALWPEHFERFASINADHMMVSARGNHEGSMYNDKDKDWFARYHEMPGAGEPVSTFDWGNTHFVLVSYEDTVSASEALDKDLQGVTARWKVVVQHFPVYCAGYDSPEDSRKESGETFAAYAQVLDKYNVQVDLAGHTHIYERMYPIRGAKRDDRSGVNYVVNGGDINANYPEELTAVKDNKRWQAKPTYTVIKCLDDRIEMCTFCWSTADNRIAQMDYLVIWDDPSVPAAALTSLEGKQGAELADAIETVGAMLYQPAIEPLAAYLKHDDAAVRRAAAAALRHVGTASTSEILAAYLADPDVAVCREAARALEITLPESFVDTAKTNALDAQQDEEVREALIGALQLHGPEATVREVSTAVLESPAPAAVRRRAAYALGRVAEAGDARTLTQLVDKETEPYVMMRLAYTLNQVTGKRVSLDSKGPLAISEPGMRREFIDTWLAK